MYHGDAIVRAYVVFPVLFLLLGGCASSPDKDPKAPNLSAYERISVSPVDSEGFLGANAEVVRGSRLAEDVQEAIDVFHGEVRGYYEDIQRGAGAGGKELLVKVSLLEFDPGNSGGRVLTAALYGTDRVRATETVGVGGVVYNVQLIDAVTRDVLYGFEATGTAEDDDPSVRSARAARACAEEVVRRLERMSRRTFRPDSLPSRRRSPGG